MNVSQKLALAILALAFLVQCGGGGGGGDSGGTGLVTKQILFVRQMSSDSYDTDIFLYDLRTNSITQLTSNSKYDYYPRWSPDGSKIAFVSNRDDNGSNNYDDDIFVMNSDGSNQVNLTHSVRNDNQPVWSPDGTTLAFISLRDSISNYNIYTIQADGTNPTKLVDYNGTQAEPDWSPDGKYLAFRKFKDSQNKIYMFEFSDGSIAPLTDTTDNYFPTWSPNSKYVLCTRNIGTGKDLVGIDIYAGYANEYITEWGMSYGARSHEPQWSPDGKEIIYVSDIQDTNDEILVCVLEGPAHFRLTNTDPPVQNSNPVWSPDGSKIAFVRSIGGKKSIWVMNADGSNQTQLTNPEFNDYSPQWRPQ